MDSCIVFIYEKKNKDLSFIYEIGKLNKQDIQIDNHLNDTIEDSKIQLDKQIEKDSSNIRIITSDFCGLGKSFKIKKMIESKKQRYFHFPLGGILTKKDISTKIKNLLEKIKKENEKDDSKDKNEKKRN